MFLKRLVSWIRLVPMTRIERVTSPLPRECSTTELHRLKLVSLNPLNQIFTTSVHFKQLQNRQNSNKNNSMERVKGIEPSS